MKLLFRTAFFLFIFILGSCKKDKKVTTPPTITYNAPSAGQTCSYVYDSIAHKYHLPINVNARVTDVVRLASVNVSLTDINHVPLQGSVNIAITSADFVFNIIYDVSDFRLQAGTYLIQIIADDGTSATSSFQPIYVIESPTIWLGYCVSTKLNTQSIVNYDSTKAQIFTIPLTTNYNGMKYGGYNQQLYVNGNGNMPFTAYNIQSGASVYQVTATPSEIDYISLNTDGYKPYIGFKNGDIYSYTNTGMQSTSYRYSGANASYPYYFANTGANYVAVYRNIANSPLHNNVLVTFSAAGATAGDMPLINGSILNKVVGIFEKQQDSLYVLGNDTNNKAIIYIYQPSVPGFSASSIPGMGTMLSATKVSNQYIIFSTTTGIYGCNSFSTPILLQAITAQKIIYQPKLNVLVAASSTTGSGSLNAYTYTTTAGVSSLIPLSKMSLPLTDSLVDFELITNK